MPNLVRFSLSNASEPMAKLWGTWTDTGIVPFADESLHELPLSGLLKVVESRGPVAADPSSLQSSGFQNGLLEDSAYQEDEVTWQCPVSGAGKILCIGLNYRDHAIESGMAIPSEPVVFNKLHGTLCGHQQDVPLPINSQQVDFEAELVVVVGRRAWQVSEQEAEAYILGYACGHDVSARDWQIGKPGGQWLLGKSFPCFAPVGPKIVLADAAGAVGKLGITLKLNGEVQQSSTTQQLIFSVPKLVSYLSHCTVLEPGDVIFTGTPPGVGMAQTPPRFLKSGDVCEVEIDGIGRLSNRFV